MPWQTVVLPEIVPGCVDNAVTVTANVRAGPEPQELFAVTEILPLEAPTVVDIEFDVEPPLHPGKDQL